MRFVYTCLLLLALSAPSFAAEARIKKILQHLEDLEGRVARQPSLFERDAYQFELRQAPEKVGALRFDIQWASAISKDKTLNLKLEVVAANTPPQKTSVFEKAVRNTGMIGNWTQIRLDKEAYAKLGRVISWRATLWDGERMLAEQKSFLWQ